MISLEEGARSFHGCRALPEVPSLSLPLDIWTALFGLFAQCLAFVQPFNSLRRLERKYQPVAKVASLGHHPTIQGLGCLEMGADAANIVDMSFPPHYSDPLVSVGRTQSSELKPSQKSDYNMLPGSWTKNFSVGFSY